MTGVRPIYVALHNKSSTICAPQHLATQVPGFPDFLDHPDEAALPNDRTGRDADRRTRVEFPQGERASTGADISPRHYH
jgi:hypothetical protein